MRISDWSSDVCSSDLVLKGQGEKMVMGARLSLRKTLIVFQFVIAQVFIVSALIIGQQLSYTLGKDLGFTHDAVVNIPMPYRSDQGEIGRASWRERVCQYVLISVGGVQLKKKNNK